LNINPTAARYTPAFDTVEGGVSSSKVLFFSHDAKLGDAVVNTAFVAGLRKYSPHCEIHATVAGATAGFWATDQRIQTLWPLQNPGWRDIIATGLALRRERFDHMVTWRKMRSEKNRLLLLLARPRQVIDLRDFNNGEVRHQIESCREALVQIHRRNDIDLAYDLGMSARGDQLDLMLPAGQELIVVNLFAADTERTIPTAEGAEILRGLAELAPEAALCLVCTDATEAAARLVLAQRGVRGQVVNCENNLNRLIDLCNRSDLIISPDTALIHIASALDKPVIGIYQNNGIKAVQWGPRSRLHGLVLSASADGIAGFSVTQVLRQAESLREQYRLEMPSAIVAADGVPL
jgi:ADP-heptose:LPS heptosyltransferase